MNVETPPGTNRLLHQVYDNSTVIPRRMARIEGKPGKRFVMGAFDAADRPIPSSLLFRASAGGEIQVGIPGQPTASREHVAGSAIYMGILFHHFGHFLLEGLSRAWFAKANPDLPIVWSVDEPRPAEKPRNFGFARRRGAEGRAFGGPQPAYKKWQSEVLALLGIRNRPVFVSRSTTFDRLIIPDVGYMIQTYLHPDHRDFLAVVEHRPEAGRHTWLSRTRLPGPGNRSAALVDKRMAAAGWDVVYPEQFSIPEQMEILAKSERVAGEQGSAFHLLLFLKNTSGLRVDIFSRDSDLKPRKRNRNYQTIGESKSLDQKIHLCDFEKTIQRSAGGVVDKVLENSFKYLSVLGDERRMETAGLEDKTGFHSGAWSGIARIANLVAARAYLEIGIADGKTFLPLALPVKHAVDPEFRFDVRRFETEGVRFFEVPSDVFFLTFADMRTKYDIIALDGSRKFEQTFRDFCNTQSHCHDRTVWMIDGVHPDDAGHGDAFKLVFAIHDFFPNLSYRTISGGGTPRTVVVRRARKDFQPRLGDFEKISRLTDDGLAANRDLLNLATEEEVLAWLAE